MKKIVNPNPLGLIGCSITTILFNIHNAGFFKLNSIILSIGIFYGGIAQIIAGILEYKNTKGSTFSATTFISYGLFWESLISFLIVPYIACVESTPKSFLSIYFIFWGIFSSLMFIGTLKEKFIIQFNFFTLTILLFLLGIGNMYENKNIIFIAGFEGTLCGISTFYLAIAEIINEQFKKNIIPIR